MMKTITNRRGQYVEVAREDLRENIRQSVYEWRPAAQGRPAGRALRAVIRRVKGVLFTREALRADRLREAAKPEAQRKLERRPHGPEIIDMVPAKCRKSYIFLQRTYPGRSLRWYDNYRDS